MLWDTIHLPSELWGVETKTNFFLPQKCAVERNGSGGVYDDKCRDTLAQEAPCGCPQLCRSPLLHGALLITA